MKVELKPGLKPDYPTRIYLAYCISWGKNSERVQRLYSIYEPNDGLAGFDILSDQEITILDPSLDNYLLVAHGVDQQSLIHKAAYTSEAFFDALTNHDDYANVEKLRQNMRMMGLEP